MKKAFTYQQLYQINRHLKNGLGHKPLPAASVLLPLRTFSRKMRDELQDALELGKELEDQEALDELMAREVEIEFLPVKIEAVASDEYDLSLADLEVLELLSDG